MIFCFSTPPASSSDKLDAEERQESEKDNEAKLENSKESEDEDTRLEKDDFEALEEGKLQLFHLLLFIN